MASSSNRVLTKPHKWAIDFSSRNKNERLDLPSPPGYHSSLGQVQAESTKETDPNLIVKKSWDIALGPLKQVPMNLFIMYMAGNSISIFPIMMVGMLFLRPVKALLSFQAKTISMLFLWQLFPCYSYGNFSHVNPMVIFSHVIALTRRRQIGIVSNLFTEAVTNIYAFKMIEGSHAMGQKFVYMFGNLVCLALALYKCQSMGLLPTHASDWLAFVTPQERMEFSGGGVILA